MMNTKRKLEKSYDTIRRDPGISSASQCLVQLASFLMLRLVSDLCHSSENFERQSSEGYRFLWDAWAESAGTNHLSIDDIFVHAIENLNDDVNNYLYSHTAKRVIKTSLSCIDNQLISVEIFREVALQLSDIDLRDRPELQRAFESIIFKTNLKSAKYGEFFTPRVILNAIVKVLPKRDFKRLYDPAMGAGGTFVEFSRNHPNSHLTQFVGYDSNKSSYLICALTNLITDINNLDFRLADTLQIDYVSENQQYDLIVSHLPFGKAPEMHVSKFKTIESLFFDHILERMEANGVGAVIVPPNFLFDKSRNIAQLRKRLLMQCNLHTILCLPAGSFKPYIGIPAYILFFRKGESTSEIWYYEVKTDLILSRKKQLEERDFQDFIESYKVRNDSPCSWIVRYQDLGNDLVLTPKPPSKQIIHAEISIEDAVNALSQGHESIEKMLLKIGQHLESTSDFFDLVALQNTKRTKLGELIQIKTGKSLSKKSMIDNGPYPVYGGNGKIGSYDSYNRDGEYILIGRVGALCGNIHYATGKIWLTQNAMSARVIENNTIFVPYLVKLLKSLDLGQYGSGTAQKFITLSSIEKIEIALPSYSDQKKIHSWQNQLDSLVELILLDYQEQESVLNRLQARFIAALS